MIKSTKNDCVIQSISWFQKGDHVSQHQNFTNSKSIQMRFCRVKYRVLSTEYQVSVHQNAEYHTKSVAQFSIVFLIEYVNK